MIADCGNPQGVWVGLVLSNLSLCYLHKIHDHDNSMLYAGRQVLPWNISFNP